MKKVSLRVKLIRLFLITVAIPILVLSFFSYYNISDTLKQNTEELTNTNLKQIDDNLRIWMESYEDLLFQIYTNDDMVSLIDKLNDKNDVSVTKNQLRRYLRGLFNTKEYIRAITVITADGTLITYDHLNPTTYKSSWLKNFSLSQDELYQEVISDNFTHVFPTEYGTKFANENYYLFHIAHRVIDYKDLNKKNGMVIISIDEELLQNICKTQEDSKKSNNFNFLVDEVGRIISYVPQDKIGTKTFDANADMEHKLQTYRAFVKNENYYDNNYTSVYAYHDKDLNWDIVNVTNQSALMGDLNRQIIVTILISILLFVISMFLTLGMSKRLVDSVQQVVSSMKKAQAGDLTVFIEEDEKMPIEIETIALQYNDMLKKLDHALDKEKKAAEKQQRAEIKMLEAQINPHFLYNTLDTINWMAIDRDEFDISNAINALATILRYAIVNSNNEVLVKDEIEWLKKYIYLQQFRLKNNFICNIDVEPEVMGYKIHKLLLQPFVENAIIHGFEGVKSKHVLDVILSMEDQILKVIIRDNGKGIEPALLKQFNDGIFEEDSTAERDHIGMENAITRLQMYYGDLGKIYISSQLGEGTEITLVLPLKK